jgi:ABC-2 type transport system permease protein
VATASERLERLTYPKELLINLTLRELRGKYKRSALGWAWSVINPAVLIVVYTIVFGHLLGANPPPGVPSGLDSYVFFLMAALLPWMFVSNGLTGAVSSLTANENLVKKVYFPRSILPTSSVLSWLASFGIEMAVLGVLLMVLGRVMILPWIPVVIAIGILQFFFVLGLGLVLCPLNAYFRDVLHFTALFLTVWFYATPIVYPPTLLYTNGQPKEILGISIPQLMRLNPMAHFATAYRNALYDLRWPAATTWLSLILSAAAAMALGIWVFRKFEPHLAEEL